MTGAPSLRQQADAVLVMAQGDRDQMASPAWVKRYSHLPEMVALKEQQIAAAFAAAETLGRMADQDLGS